MKKQYRIINKGKGVLNIQKENLEPVHQPIPELIELKNYIDAQLDLINVPDTVLKSGDIDIVLLNVLIDADEFEWRINKIEFLNPPAVLAGKLILNAATPGYFRFDLLVGKNDGTYGIKEGEEDIAVAEVPIADAGTIALSIIGIQGDTIIDVTPPDLSGFLEKGTYVGTAETLNTDIQNRILISNIYNALDYAIAGKVLDARQGKVLKDDLDVLYSLLSAKESAANKTNIVIGNEASTSLYLNILGAVTYFQQKLTDITLGNLIVALSNKTALVDTDTTLLSDSADSGKAKEVSWLNVYNYISSKIVDTETYACSDEVSALNVGLVITFRMPYHMTLSNVKISLNTAPTITKLIVDIRKGGVSIFSTLLSVDTGQTTSVGASVPAVISNNDLVNDSVITIYVTQIGSGVAGTGLKVTLLGKKL